MNRLHHLNLTESMASTGSEQVMRFHHGQDGNFDNLPAEINVESRTDIRARSPGHELDTSGRGPYGLEVEALPADHDG